MTDENSQPPLRYDVETWPIDDKPPGVYAWLQAWYATQCDGDWEHQHGITISTLDNPGWMVDIQLEGTLGDLDGRTFRKVEFHRTEHDWIVASVEDKTFRAHCGPLNLGECLWVFRQWVDPEGNLPDPWRTLGQT